MITEPFYTKRLGDVAIHVAKTGKDTFEIEAYLKDQSKAVIEKKGSFWKKAKTLQSVVDELKGAGLIENEYQLNGWSVEIDRSYTTFTTTTNTKLSEDSEHSEHSAVEALYTDVLMSVSKPALTHKSTPVLGLFHDVHYTMFTETRTTPTGLDFRPVIVLSNRTAHFLTNEYMDESGLYFEFIPKYSISRWSREAIAKFIQPDKYPIKTLTSFDIFERVTDQFRRHVEFSEGDVVCKFMALWTIGTYFQEFWTAYPYCFLNGVKASGKTRTLEVVNQLAFNSAFSVGMSDAALFRMILSARPTLLLDEAETMKDKKSERSMRIRELLLSGYKKGTMTYRAEEEVIDGVKRYVVKAFALFCPKVICNITGLEDVLESRVISITMRPTTRSEIASCDVNPNDIYWGEIRDGIYAFLMAYWPAVQYLHGELQNPGDFRNREWELWKPILCLAKLFENDAHTLYEEILSFAKRKVAEARIEEETETNDVLFCRYLTGLVLQSGYFKISDMILPFAEYLDLPIKEDRDGTRRAPKWLNAKYMGGMCRRLGFRQKRRTNKGYNVYLSKEEVWDQARRMGIDPEDPDGAKAIAAEEAVARQRAEEERKREEARKSLKLGQGSLDAFRGGATADEKDREESNAVASLLSSGELVQLIQDAIPKVADENHLSDILAIGRNIFGVSEVSEEQGAALLDVIEQLKHEGVLLEPRPGKVKFL